jgi:hypothetical protein
MLKAKKIFEEFGDGGYGSATSSKKQRSVCSCHLCSEEADLYRLPGVSVRGGGDDDDEDDDYDSGDEDDEVDHEDEAKDPWATKRKYSKALIRGGDDDEDGDGSDWENSADAGEDEVDHEDEARHPWWMKRKMYFDNDSNNDVRLAYAIRLSKGIDISPPPLDYRQYMRDMGRRLMEADWENEDGWDNVDDGNEDLDVAERWNSIPAAEQHGFTHYTFPMTAGKPGEDNEWMKGLDWTRIYDEKPVTDAQQAPEIPDDGLSRLLRQAQACHAEYERQKKELKPRKERMKVGEFTVIDQVSVKIQCTDSTR